MATKKEQTELGREVADFFTQNPANEFIGFAGLGRHGGALILKEHDDYGFEKRKVVVKYSLGELTGDEESDADADLRNEYNWLLRLRGAEHVVRLVPFADCSLKLPGMSNGEATYPSAEAAYAQLQEDVKAYQEGRTIITDRARKCPTFALEYLPNGQLSDTVEKHQFLKVNMPNRILWRIWLCLVRQCVAMAYPPNMAMTEEDDWVTKREEINPNQQICRLCQNSAHLENWIWGPERYGNIPDTDHDPHLPVVKIIDFGRGALEKVEDWASHRLPDPETCGYTNNLWNAALMMLEIIFPVEEPEDIAVEKEPHYYIYPLGEDEWRMRTYAPELLRTNERIDRALRDVLVRSLALWARHAPTLEFVLRDAIQHVAEAPGGTDGVESDDTMRKWTQRFLYDAFEFE